MKYCFGVDLGGTTVKLGLFEEGGQLSDKWEIVTNTNNEGEAILPDIAKTISNKMVERNIQKEDIIGVGMGVPAPVTAEGTVTGSANLGWKYKEVKKELDGLLGLNVLVGNDANVAALGEMWKGGGSGEKNMIMVTLGTGVGGGIISDGRIVIGNHGAGGEIGHITVNYEETEVCGCGNKGCLEQYASATGIVRLAKKKLLNETRQTKLVRESVTAKDVFDCVKEGDLVAIEIAQEFGHYLGYALANICTLMDPAVIVIGGGVSKAGDVLLEFVEKAFRERVFFANETVKFALAKLGNDAGIYGAAKMFLED